jgi:DNA-binding NtrC family response regulator
MASRILIVDDNEAALGVLTEGLRLRMGDVVIDSSTSMEHALSKASSQNYDVVVVNTVMVRTGGIILTAALQELCPEAAVLAVALSAYCPRAESEVDPSAIEELEELLRIPISHRQFRWAS